MSIAGLRALRKVSDKGHSGPLSAGRLSEMIIEGMVGTSASLGILSGAVDSEWSVKTVEVVPGVHVDVRNGMHTVVDVSGPVLAREVAAAADRVYHAVAASLEAEKSGTLGKTFSHLRRHATLGLDPNKVHARPEVNAAVALRLLDAQGWFRSGATLVSPTWVYPSVTLTLHGFTSMVEEETQYLLSLPDESPATAPEPSKSAPDLDWNDPLL